MAVSDKEVYRDPAQPLEARVADLLSRMTLEEKAAQMVTFSIGGMDGGLLSAVPPEEIRSFMVRMGAEEDWFDQPAPAERPVSALEKDGTVNLERARALMQSASGGQAGGITSFSPRKNAEAANALQKLAVEETRLGVPILFIGEAVHGHVANGATIFPQALGMASTWNPELIGQIGRVIGTEARAVGTHQVYAPVLDLGREPRWGRTEETYGEDPYLASRMGVAMVKGMQGRQISDPDAIIVGLKHFGGHGEPLGGRDSNMEGITERDLREAHFQTFRAAIQEGGALGVMAAYHAIDGVPCHANYWLLTEILRHEWGFQGHVVSDAFAVEGLHQKHRVAADEKEAVRLTIEAGLDSHLGPGPLFSQAVVDLVHEGKLSEDKVNQAVRWILRLKFMLGLFERPYIDPERAERICSAPGHRTLALKAARQSLVLLKNEGNLLPLSKNVKSILVAGPNADAPQNQIGDYSGSNDIVTVLAGIKNKVAPGTQVRYVRGCGIKDLNSDGIAEAVVAAKECEVAVLVLGESSWTAGMTSGEGNDRAELGLPGVQQQLLEAVSATGTPVILVLITGRPLTIPWAAEHVPAIVQAWYPGEEGGTAIADVLWGDCNPSGKLPITMARTVGQLPLYYNYKPSGRAYDYVLTSGKPLFEFGYGLSYTRFEYDSLAITPQKIGPAGQVTVSVVVKNAGDRAGDEVVQLYINDLISSVVTPLKELKGFQRVSLQPGESRQVTFTLGSRQLALLDRHLEPVVEPGTFEVMVGGLKAAFEVI